MSIPIYYNSLIIIAEFTIEVEVQKQDLKSRVLTSNLVKTKVLSKQGNKQHSSPLNKNDLVLYAGKEQVEIAYGIHSTNLRCTWSAAESKTINKKYTLYVAYVQEQETQGAQERNFLKWPGVSIEIGENFCCLSDLISNEKRYSGSIVPRVQKVQDTVTSVCNKGLFAPEPRADCMRFVLELQCCMLMRHMFRWQTSK